MAMVMMASSAFHAGHPDVAEIETAYHTLTPLLGIGAAGVFLVSLIASGVSSSTVGTMAGQMIMQGFVGFRIPIWVRRLVTMVPAFVVVALGVNATNALVVSQVVLSIALPLPMMALSDLHQRADIMGGFSNGPVTPVAAVVGTVAVFVLNLLLIILILGVPIPGSIEHALTGQRPRLVASCRKPVEHKRRPEVAGRMTHHANLVKQTSDSRGFRKGSTHLTRYALKAETTARPQPRFRRSHHSVFKFSAADLPVLRSTTTSNATFWPSLSSRRPARSTALI